MSSINTTCFLCAYNEEETISRACKSIIRQSISFDEFILIDSGSDDATADIASSYVDRIIQAPKGKLSARNYAINPPDDAPWDGPKGDIIVNTDADKYYPPEWAYLILRHFNNENVVAVTGETRYQENGEKNLESMIADAVEVGLRGWMKTFFSEGHTLEGGNSAFRKWVFDEVGGFDASWVDQSEIWQVFHEEEFYTPYRMAQHGDVIIEDNAVALEPPRRLTATFLDTEFSKEVDEGMRM